MLKPHVKLYCNLWSCLQDNNCQWVDTNSSLCIYFSLRTKVFCPQFVDVTLSQTFLKKKKPKALIVCHLSKQWLSKGILSLSQYDIQIDSESSEIQTK
jgi:hypothetical protein